MYRCLPLPAALSTAAHCCECVQLANPQRQGCMPACPRMECLSTSRGFSATRSPHRDLIWNEKKAEALGEPHRKVLPGLQGDPEVLAHVQSPDAPLLQHLRQAPQLRVPKALRSGHPRCVTRQPGQALAPVYAYVAPPGLQPVRFSMPKSTACTLLFQWQKTVACTV